MSIKGKVVVITGSTSGIGFGIAKGFAQAGANVMINGLAESKVVEGILEELRDYGIKAIYHGADMTQPAQIKDLISSTVAEFGALDILINNAGYALVSTVEEVTEQEMFNQFNINVFGIFRVCKEVIPLMRQSNSGVIINISSFLGKVGLPLLTFYNSSKYAVEGITDSLRYELSDFNIRVHSIMPGFFNTNFAKGNLVVNSSIDADNPHYGQLIANLVPNIIDQIKLLWLN